MNQAEKRAARREFTRRIKAEIYAQENACRHRAAEMSDSGLLDAYQGPIGPGQSAAARELAARIRRGTWTLGG